MGKQRDLMPLIALYVGLMHLASPKCLDNENGCYGKKLVSFQRLAAAIVWLKTKWSPFLINSNSNEPFDESSKRATRGSSSRSVEMPTSFPWIISYCGSLPRPRRAWPANEPELSGARSSHAFIRRSLRQCRRIGEDLRLFASTKSSVASALVLSRDRSPRAQEGENSSIICSLFFFLPTSCSR